MDENGVWSEVIVIVDNIGEICARFVASPGVRNKIFVTCWNFIQRIDIGRAFAVECLVRNQERGRGVGAM